MAAMMPLAPTREAFPTNPEDFDADDRISYSKTSETYVLEAEDGSEWEFAPKAGKWVAVMSEDDVEKQRQVYAVKGVDESVPVPVPVPAVDIRKRKQTDDVDEEDEELFNYTPAEAPKPKKQKPEPAPKPERQNTAIYVTSLPDKIDVDDIYDVFKRFGVIAESVDSNTPRIKLYYDDKGDFKGEALIIYYRPESVGMAIDMLDETDFRPGERLPTGPMRVRVADSSYKSQKDQPLQSDDAKKKGTTMNRDRKKVIEKTQKMNERLADWGDDGDDDPSQVANTSSRYDKIMVLKHLFTIEELAEEAEGEAEAEIKKDVREECEKFGEVTNVVLYDQEADGVVTVRFADAMAAKAAVKVFDGRSYDYRTVKAYIAKDKERFKKTRRKSGTPEESEEARLAKFSKDIEEEE